ncbi:hypothetical protein IAU60_001186 [Kwoniella sp. DSM 27419]
MDIKSAVAFVAAMAGWRAASLNGPKQSPVTTCRGLPTSPGCPVTGHKSADASKRCPVSGHEWDSTLSGCPLAQGTPLPDPGHRCSPSSMDELRIPEVPPLTDKQREIIKATVPVLAEHGVTITTHFYKNMIRAHPELREVFSESAQKMGHQPRALASAVYAYACNIDDLTPLLPVVVRIAHKHASLHIVAEQYGIVGKHLIQSLVDILGEAVTPEIADAWYKGYWNLAKVFIQRERDIYTASVQAGGWEGWKQFKVDKRVQESEEITSFYLKPVDGSKLPEYHPGQYIAVSLYIPALGHKQARQYSLSDSPNGEYFRISVKREDGVPVPTPADPTVPAHPGWLSNVIHRDIHEGGLIDVAAPFGSFFFESSVSNPRSPLVLLSAGVGQTALLSILNSQLATGRPITYATAARNKAVRAFAGYLRKVGEEHPNVTVKVFLSSPEGGAVQGSDYDFRGRMRLQQIEEDLHLDDRTTQYFLCGPGAFMVDKMEELKGMGVEASRIHAEMFGSGNLPSVQ